MRNNILFGIDCQNSFMGHSDGRPYEGRAELPVAGAIEDMNRLAAYIDADANGEGIDDIVLTLDTHETLFGDRDIGHPHYWRDTAGNHPAPFTQISFNDVADKKWMPYDPSLSEKTLHYLSAVGTHMVWPLHCRLGTWGHDVYEPLNAAITRWTKRTGKNPWVVRKGMNCHSEQYGAFEAAVPDPNDPTTQFNWTLLNHLRKATKVWVAGEAKSHCVKTTIEQAAAKLSTEEIRKFVLLTDCMSSVTGFYTAGEFFVVRMQNGGMNVMNVAA